MAGCSFDDPQMISQCLQQAAQAIGQAGKHKNQKANERRYITKNGFQNSTTLNPIVSFDSISPLKLQADLQVVQELLSNSGSPRPPRSPPKGQAGGSSL